MFKLNLSTKLHGITSQKAMLLVFSMLFKDKCIPEEDLTFPQHFMRPKYLCVTGLLVIHIFYSMSAAEIYVRRYCFVCE
jgi:hypothetical protein